MNQHAKILQGQTTTLNSQTQHFEGQKSPRCHLMWKLSLAPPWRRITHKSTGNMLYESIELKELKSPTVPGDILSKLFIYNANFWFFHLYFKFVIFCHLLVSSGSSNGFLKSSLLPKYPRSILEWSWIDSGSIIFQVFFMKIFTHCWHEVPSFHQPSNNRWDMQPALK